MQNLINELLVPGPGLTGPTTLQRRAADAISNLSQLRQQDQQFRVHYQNESDKHLAELIELRAKYGIFNHEQTYREAMNEDYRLNFL